MALALLGGCRAVPAPDAFAVQLEIMPLVAESRFTLIEDAFGAGGTSAAWQSLPAMSVALVVADDRLVPARRGWTPTDHPAWEYSIEPGRLAPGPASGRRSAVLPFTLHERNANCVHHGWLALELEGDRVRPHAHFRIAGETCQYFRFDAQGKVRVTSVPLPPAVAAEVSARFAHERAGRLPVRPIEALADHYPGADPGQFGSAAEVQPEHMTAYGFVADGVHYLGGCRLRSGPHPCCEELVLPSYSLAKSLFAGLAAMRAERLYPGVTDTVIGAVVEACRDRPEWQDVTIADALDMATGNFHSDAPMADEEAAVLDEFFLAEDHATKVAAACGTYPRRAPPGTRWVYHTSDTYLAGVALRAALRARLGRDVDLYEELVWQPIFAPLGLGPAARQPRRTYDAEAQPFFGWGLYFQPGDLARLAQFLGPDAGRVHGEAVLDERMFAAATRRDPSHSALPADIEGMVYRHGFRAYDAGPALGCDRPAWVTVLSGFGGIILAVFPNGTAYYYASDGGDQRWLAAAREAHRIRPFCA